MNPWVVASIPAQPAAKAAGRGAPVTGFSACAGAVGGDFCCHLSERIIYVRELFGPFLSQAGILPSGRWFESSRPHLR